MSHQQTALLLDQLLSCWCFEQVQSMNHLIVKDLTKIPHVDRQELSCALALVLMRVLVAAAITQAIGVMEFPKFAFPRKFIYGSHAWCAARSADLRLRRRWWWSSHRSEPLSVMPLASQFFLLHPRKHRSTGHVGWLLKAHPQSKLIFQTHQELLDEQPRIQICV